jgi:hypothetical protein
LAIFGNEWNKGRLRSKMAHRYLVKLIQSCQEEDDLRIQEELLRKYTQKERQGWLQEFETEYQLMINFPLSVAISVGYLKPGGMIGSY